MSTLSKITALFCLACFSIGFYFCFDCMYVNMKFVNAHFGTWYSLLMFNAMGMIASFIACAFVVLEKVFVKTQ